MKRLFRHIATKVSLAAGSPAVFLLAIMLVIVWSITGPLFNYSNSWQLFINTLTTITTFLMVFLIQNTQNRESKAVQLKLDEIIRSTKARDSFVDLEDLSDDELEYLSEEFRVLHQKNQNPSLLKMHTKLSNIHSARKSNQKSVVNQVANLLNPFSHDDK